MPEVELNAGTMIGKIYRFYRHECCVPYTISFILTLVIYYLDFFVYEKLLLWPSFASYSVLAAYFVYIMVQYYRGLIPYEEPRFFVAVLTVKISVWGLALALLAAFT